MENTKKIVLNPVLAVPWKTQEKMKKYGDPTLFLSSTKSVHKQKPFSLAEHQRITNVELLLARFPGLKKYQARAALTIAQNRLDKAILLLEVSNCYRREVAEDKPDMSFLKNIHINLQYDSEKHDPTLRNVILESSIETKKTNSSQRRVRENSTGVTTSEDSDVLSSKAQKIGVIIRKTINGYIATPLDEVY